MQMRKSMFSLIAAVVLSTQVLAAPAHTVGTPMAISPHSSELAAGESHFPYPHRTSTNGSGILYSQIYNVVGGFENAAPSEQLPPDWFIYSSKGADDFTVTDPTGWNISAFNFRVWFRYQQLLWQPPAGTTYAIDIYPDAAGVPALHPICTYAGLNGTLDEASGNRDLSVPLTSSCFLPQGTYWVSMYPVALLYPPQAFWVTSPVTGLGAHAVWQNHFGGFGFGCSAWADMTTCTTMMDGYPDPQHLADGESAFQFEVIGTLGGDSCNGSGAGICLSTTLGTDMADGACGAAKMLEVIVGDQVNFCYTVTNNTGMTLDFQSLGDNINGTLLDRVPESLAAGASYQFNRIVTLGSTKTATSTWTSQDVPPGYDAVATSNTGRVLDRVFCDGFDGNACTAGSSAGFVDIKAIGTATGLREDASVGVAMPFSFNFFGVTSNRICIDENGFILFGTSICPLSGYWTNGMLPTYLLPGPVILPLWDDFTETSGDVYYATTGMAPNRQFIVEWYNRVAYDGALNTDGATFEVVFDEASGKISFEYADVDYTGYGSYAGIPICNGGLCATIGLQNDPALASPFSYREAAVASGSGIDWHQRSPQIFASSDTVTVDVGEARIDVEPKSVSGWVPAGGSAVLNLDINNVGTRDLNWSTAKGPSADAHFPPPGSRFAMPLGDPVQARATPAPLRMDHSLHRMDKPATGIRAAFGTGIAPTFSDDVYNDEFVAFDAASPSSTTLVSPVPGGYKLTGGAFIDGDFATMYAVDGFGASTTNQFLRVDTATGAITPIGSAASLLGQNYSSLKYDPTTARLYASSISGDCTGTSRLWTIDKATGVPTYVGPILGTSCIAAIAIDRAGLMYGIDLIADALYAIDKTTGNASLIGSIGFNANYAQDADFDQSTGILYYAGFDGDREVGNMYTVNVATGEATLIAPIGSFTEMDAMAIATIYGPCSNAADLPWLTINPPSGTTLRGGTSPVSLAIDGSGQVGGAVLKGTVCVTSNDRYEHIVAVPIEVRVPQAIGLSKAFAPASVTVNTDSTLTITLTNANPVPAVLTTQMWDHLPSGLVVSPVSANAVTTCPNGIIGFALGGDSVSLGGTDAQIPAMGSCTVSISVRPSISGSLLNTIPAGTLQTNLGNSPADASASLEATGENTIVDSGFIFLEVPDDEVGLYINWMTGATCTSATAGGCNAPDYNFHAYHDPLALGTQYLAFEWPHASDNCVLKPAGNNNCALLDYGSVIGPASPTGHGNANLWITQSVLGFSFLNPTSGQVNYGFANVISSMDNGFPAYVVEYWYDKSGAAIKAEW